MKPCKCSFLALAAMATLLLVPGHTDAQNDMPAARALFQTTRWLNPVDFSHDASIAASPIKDESGGLVFLQFSAPQGGSLNASTLTPDGYNIKKVLVCSNQNKPIAGLTVSLSTDAPNRLPIQLPFERMSSPPTGCALYATGTGSDDWGQAGQTLDAKYYKRLEIRLPPSNIPADIEAVGLRLQAAAPNRPRTPPPQWRPAHQDDLGDVYISLLAANPVSPSGESRNR
jgi:hypothetical protein